MDKQIFKNPRAEKSLDHVQAPLWFLNDKLEKEELLRQLELMRSKGVTNCMPNGRNGFIGEYMNEEWFDNIKTIIEDKRMAGEPLWIYDEFDWPAGTCNRTITLDENLREQYLEIRKVEVLAGDVYRYHALATCLNVSAFPSDGSGPHDLSVYYASKDANVIEYIPELDTEIYEVNLCIDPYRGAGGGSVNYLDKNATQAFIASTYEKYFEHFSDDFGTTIQGFFNDETRLCNALAWSDEFSGVFRETKGYDIVPLLGYLIQPGLEAGRVRCDYFDVVAHLYGNNYLKVLEEWCLAHNVGFAAHLLAEETLAGQVRYNGDYMRQLRHMTFPGVDHLGKGIGSLNIKYGSSAAHNYGKKNFNCEVFAGCGWEMTVEEALRITSWLYQQGVEIIVNHAFFYSIRDQRANDWPPSQFFQWKDWERMDDYNAMVRRLNHSLTGGRHEAETLIYNPVESFWLHYIADQRFKHGYFDHGPKIVSERAAFIDAELQKLMTELQDLNIDFDIFNADALDGFEAVDGELINKHNGERFKVFVLPLAEVLPLEVLVLLQAFASQGGKVIAMERLPEYAMSKVDDEKLRGIIEEMRAKGQITLLPIGETGMLAERINGAAPQPIRIIEGVSGTKHTLAYYRDEIIDPYLHDGEDLSGVAYTRFLKNGRRSFYFVNYNPQEEKLTVEVESMAHPEIWDTLTGDISEAEVIGKQGVTYTLNLALPPGYGILLVTQVSKI